MHDPRTSTALRHVADLSAKPPPSRWSWAIARLDTKGRVRVPRDALDLLGPGPWALRWHRFAVVLQAGETGRTPDGRGRLLLPMQLRQRDATYVIGSDRQRQLVVIAPSSTLDGLGDVLTGPAR